MPPLRGRESADSVLWLRLPTHLYGFARNSVLTQRLVRGGGSVVVFLFILFCFVQFFVTEVEAEVRLAACASDLEGDFGAGAILMKEGVHRF